MIGSIMFLRILALAAVGVVATEASVPRQLQPSNSSIGDLIANDPELTKLAAALSNITASEELSTILSSGGFTLLAPTDAAFAAVANDTIAQRVLGNAGYANHLENLIALHVAAGIAKAADLGTMLEMANGETVTVAAGPTLSGPSNKVPAKVTASDIMAANGVIHKIDTLLLPTFWSTDVVTLAETADIESLATLKMLFEVVKENPMVSVVLDVARVSQVTLFAPTDTAFAELGTGAVETITSDGTFLLEVLQNHVVLGTVYPYASLVDELSINTLRNGPVIIDREEVLGEETILVGESKLLDIVLANNGIIYTIEEVLLSDEDRLQLEATTPGGGSPTEAPGVIAPAPTGAPVTGIDPAPTIDIAPPPTEKPVAAPTDAPKPMAAPTTAPVAPVGNTTAPMAISPMATKAPVTTTKTKPSAMPIASPPTSSAAPPTAPASDAVMHFGIAAATGLAVLLVLAH